MRYLFALIVLVLATPVQADDEHTIRCYFRNVAGQLVDKDGVRGKEGSRTCGMSWATYETIPKTVKAVQAPRAGVATHTRCGVSKWKANDYIVQWIPGACPEVVASATFQATYRTAL